MDNDDAPVGRVLSRREAFRLLALGGAAVLVGCERGTRAALADSSRAATARSGTVASAGASLPGCVVRPELTVGPYFVDHQLARSDIRVEPATGKVVDGAPLTLTFAVSRVDGGRCSPLAGAMVDVWHCDARGVYSGVNDPMMGANTSGQHFLRGYQVTDAGGIARFTTIYPGWYNGRTVHIHFKIRTPASAAVAGAAAGTYEFTSQLFFDEALSDRVYANAPYASKGKRDTTNASDGIYEQSGGQLLLEVDSTATTHDARLDIGLDLANAETGKPDANGGPGGPPPSNNSKGVSTQQERERGAAKA